MCLHQSHRCSLSLAKFMCSRRSHNCRVPHQVHVFTPVPRVFPEPRQVHVLPTVSPVSCASPSSCATDSPNSVMCHTKAYAYICPDSALILWQLSTQCANRHEHMLISARQCPVFAKCMCFHQTYHFPVHRQVHVDTSVIPPGTSVYISQTSSSCPV